MTEGRDPCHEPHRGVTDVGSIDDLQGLSLQAVQELVLVITKKGVIDYAAIVKNRPDDGLVDAEELLGIEAMVL